MKNETTLAMLADEYLEGARLLDELIEKYKGRLNHAIKEKNLEDALLYKRILRMYRGCRYETLETAAHLKTYYDI